LPAVNSIFLQTFHQVRSFLDIQYSATRNQLTPSIKLLWIIFKAGGEFTALLKFNWMRAILKVKMLTWMFCFVLKILKDWEPFKLVSLDFNILKNTYLKDRCAWNLYLSKTWTLIRPRSGCRPLDAARAAQLGDQQCGQVRQSRRWLFLLVPMCAGGDRRRGHAFVSIFGNNLSSLPPLRRASTVDGTQFVESPEGPGEVHGE
jgi:hypothetical protein